MKREPAFTSYKKTVFQSHDRIRFFWYARYEHYLMGGSPE